MPSNTENKDTWTPITDAFGDYLNKGVSILKIIKKYEGKVYSDMQYPFFKEACDEGLCYSENIDDESAVKVNARKYLKFFYKLGFIDISPVISITVLGERLLNSSNNNEKKEILREALETLYYWNPTERFMSRDFDIFPFKTTVYILSKLNYLTKKEVGHYLIKLKNSDEADDLIDKIKRKRDANEDLSELSRNMSNRANWTMNLFANSDLINLDNHKLILNSEKTEEIKSLLETDDLNVPENFEDTPLTRKLYELKDAEIVFPKSIKSKSKKYTRNFELLEKANKKHQELVKSMVELLHEKEIEPEMSIRIDLLGRNNNNIALFEMKSLSKKNERTQIMKGFSQLHEYSFFDLSNESEDILKFLVLEKKPFVEAHIKFLRHYGIYVLWESNDGFSGEEESIRKLNEFLE